MTSNLFYPSHFIDLAVKLNDNVDLLTKECNCQYKECIVRTVIDRAYYAAFLHARDWLDVNETNFTITGKGIDHKNVRICLKKKGMKWIADILYDLHNKRKIADYETVRIVDASFARDVISMANNVIMSLN